MSIEEDIPKDTATWEASHDNLGKQNMRRQGACGLLQIRAETCLESA